MALIDNPGNQLPGSDQEEYKHGDEYPQASNQLGSHVPGMPEQLLPGVGGGQNMGAMGGEVGLQQDRDNLYNSDGSGMFNDSNDQRDPGGMDAMRGLAGGNPPIEILSNENMYSSQGPIPFAVPLPDTAQSEIPYDAGESPTERTDE